MACLGAAATHGNPGLRTNVRILIPIPSILPPPSSLLTAWFLHHDSSIRAEAAVLRRAMRHSRPPSPCAPSSV